MKTTELKKLIKGAVKEAIQEELKDILLEAVRAPRIGGTAAPSQVMESTIMAPPTTNVAQPVNPMTGEQRRESYKNILNNTSGTHTTDNIQGQFQPQANFDSSNGSLPAGDVGMDQIMSMMTK
jgi:hypothetical protein